MTSPVVVPAGVEAPGTPQLSAWTQWQRHGFAALEMLADTVIGEHRVRLACPGRPSWTLRGRQWTALPDQEAASLLRSPVPTTSRLLLVVRDHPQVVLTELATASARRPAEVAPWLGWPRLGRSGWWPVTIQDRLAARSNDYWLLELAAAAVGLTEMTQAPAPPVAAAPGTSVVIPARDVQDTLLETVQAIIAAADQLPAGVPWECVVVDDATFPPLRLQAGLPPQVSLLRSDVQVCCGGARNLGIERVRYPVVVFCDADTQIAPNYLIEHAVRHLLAPNLITVSLREYLNEAAPTPRRSPDGSRDTRVQASYRPGRLGLVPVTEPVTVRALDETRRFRDFGDGRLLGPVDLPFMVKGNNLVVSAEIARIGFPPDFVGYGPEDGCFAAKSIARGAFVVPVLSTGVFHRNHPPRSGSYAARDAELIPNLTRQARHLGTPADDPWITAETRQRSAAP